MTDYKLMPKQITVEMADAFWEEYSKSRTDDLLMRCYNAMYAVAPQLAEQWEPETGFSDYDSGLINDFGGGNVAWWQDYIRCEVERANDFWRDQLEPLLTLPALPAQVPKGYAIVERSFVREDAIKAGLKVMELALQAGCTNRAVVSAMFSDMVLKADVSGQLTAAPQPETGKNRYGLDMDYFVDRRPPQAGDQP